MTTDTIRAAVGAMSDEEIKAIAQQWFTTGENQLRADGYYYRSLGTVTNVRESDLIAFAREVLAARNRVPAWTLLTVPTLAALEEGGEPKLAADDLRKAMRRAFHLGQTYWMHADSESFIQNQKADRAQALFNELTEETVAAAAGGVGINGLTEAETSATASVFGLAASPTAAPKEEGELNRVGMFLQRVRSAARQWSTAVTAASESSAPLVDGEPEGARILTKYSQLKLLDAADEMQAVQMEIDALYTRPIAADTQGAVQLAGGWGELREGEHYERVTQGDAKDAARHTRTDPNQPWTPEHCRNYPTEAAALLNARGVEGKAGDEGGKGDTRVLTEALYHVAMYGDRGDPNKLFDAIAEELRTHGVKEVAPAQPSQDQIDAAILNCFALHGLVKNPDALVKAGRALLAHGVMDTDAAAVLRELVEAGEGGFVDVKADGGMYRGLTPKFKAAWDAAVAHVHARINATSGVKELDNQTFSASSTGGVES